MNKIYKKILTKSILFSLYSLFILNVSAKEGMWIPATLKAREADMKSMGLQIPVEQLFNDTGTGLNNAVVLFGKGCTGEIISPQGIVLTNHHCGYGTVQRLCGPGKDYFANGFAAKNKEEELPCAGLTVTFIRKMENITDKILFDVPDTLNDAARDTIVMNRIKLLETEYKKKTGLDATIKPYYQGNQYWILITETFKDIRLVLFPPNGIGNFGGDVENWVWPRHTGDFSVFRVYADKDNKPAEYNKDNVPYTAKQYFNINVSGYKEGDFTMVYGFPGTTDEYASAAKLKQVYSIYDPISIEARTIRLKIWMDNMTEKRDVFLQYTSKYAGVANGWKKWQGEVLGLKANNVTDKKNKYEIGFQNWANKYMKLPYAKNILPQINEQAKTVDSLIYLDQMNKETVMAIELIQQAAVLEKMRFCFRISKSDAELRDTLNKIATSTAGFYKNYDLKTDKKVFIKLMALYVKKCENKLPYYIQETFVHNILLADYKLSNKVTLKQVLGASTDKILEQACEVWANKIYDSSLLVSQERLNAFVAAITMADSTKMMADPAWKLYNEITTLTKQNIAPYLDYYYYNMRHLNRLYMKAQMEKETKKAFYPDANLTLRLSYGKVQGLKPENSKTYSYQTFLSNVIALDDSTSTIFKVPNKLKELYKTKNYGSWGQNGTIPVAFIASNHTSGGNSGSPVLNGKGELIGTNFDRAYEGTMSDYYFDMSRCRNISVDIRYTLFIIDKFCDAGWLIKEMNIKGIK